MAGGISGSRYSVNGDSRERDRLSKTMDGKFDKLSNRRRQAYYNNKFEDIAILLNEAETLGSKASVDTLNLNSQSEESILSSRDAEYSLFPDR